MNKNPWETEEGKLIWKNQSQYFTWLRGALRRLWSDYPVRQQWKKQQLRKVTAQEKDDRIFHPSTKNVGQCHYCSEWFAGSKLEVDHKIASNGCNNKEQAEEFLWYCGGQNGDSWVLACKPCHKIKTHSERKGITFEEARVEKRAIELCKLPTNKQVEILDKYELVSNNAKVRREGFMKLLSDGKDI